MSFIFVFQLINCIDNATAIPQPTLQKNKLDFSHLNDIFISMLDNISLYF